MINEIHLEKNSFITDIINQCSFLNLSLKNLLSTAVDAYIRDYIFPPISEALYKKLTINPFAVYLDDEKITFKPIRMDVLRLTVIQDKKWKTKQPPYLFREEKHVNYKLLLKNNSIIKAQFIKDGKKYYWMNVIGKTPVPSKQIVGWDFINQ